MSEGLKTAYNFKRSQVQHKQYLREEKFQAETRRILGSCLSVSVTKIKCMREEKM